MVKATLEWPAALLTLFRSAPERMDNVTNECRRRLRFIGPSSLARSMIGLRCLKTRSRKLSGVPIFVAKTKLLFWYLLPRRRRISSCEVLCAFRARATVVLKLIVLRLDWVFTSSIFQPPPYRIAAMQVDSSHEL